LSVESLAMIRDFAKEKIDIPEKAREMLLEWISLAPEMEGTFAECAKTIKGRNPMILGIRRTSQPCTNQSRSFLMTLQFLPPSPRVEPSTPTPNVEPRT